MGEYVFADVAALHDAMLTKDPGSFVSHHIFEPVPFAFGSNLGVWIEWKRILAAQIDVDPQDIVMTGSAAVGFSLNPYKRFKVFDAASDLDCGVVSGHYFDAAWRYLRQLRVSWLDLPGPSRAAINDHRSRHVFAGTIAADRMLELLPFGECWQSALDTMSQTEPTQGRDVKLRIYKDFDALRYYQTTNIRKLTERLVGKDDLEPALDTILNGLPIPELYMQDVGNEAGEEKHIVVDGQQRVRAVLDYVQGNFPLEGDDVGKKWRGLRFDDLSVDDKKAVFNYKFVVRILPSNLKEEDIRAVFARLNKNVVSLTDQELRNATYWGPFIKAIQQMADQDPFWAASGLFSANDVRRMNDHEYISELAIAYLRGPQNKKDRLDYYYRLYEEEFDDRSDLMDTFQRVTAEIARIVPRLVGTRWKKKSDFYTLFLELAARKDRIPFDDARLEEISGRFLEFGSRIDSLLRLEENDWGSHDEQVVTYARHVARAASDRNSRVARSSAVSRFVFEEEPVDSVQDKSAPAMQSAGAAAL